MICSRLETHATENNPLMYYEVFKGFEAPVLL